jgi:hypothetical protein
VPGPPGPPVSDAAATPHRSRPAVRLTSARPERSRPDIWPPDETGAEVIEHLFEHWKRSAARRQSSTAGAPGAPPRPPPTLETESKPISTQTSSTTPPTVSVALKMTPETTLKNDDEDNLGNNTGTYRDLGRRAHIGCNP